MCSLFCGTICLLFVNSVLGLPQVPLTQEPTAELSTSKPVVETTTTKLHEEYFRPDYTRVLALRAFYKLHVTTRSWHDARVRCEAEGATLLTPQSDLEVDAVRYMMGVIPSRYGAMFVGLHSFFGNGDFVDLEGNPIEAVYHSWSDGEPNNAGGTESCVVLTRDAHLNDVNCGSAYPFVCKKSFDNLTHNPTCETYDLEYKFNRQQSKCYKIHAQPKTWQNAYSTCTAEGSYLAIINSELEDASLVTLMEEYPPDSIVGQSWKSGFHIGFHSLFEEGEFRTVHGETLEKAGYNNWSDGQPEGTGDSQRCGAVLRDGSLDDVACVRRAPFICERKVDKPKLNTAGSDAVTKSTVNIDEKTPTSKEPVPRPINSFVSSLEECEEE